MDGERERKRDDAGEKTRPQAYNCVASTFQYSLRCLDSSSTGWVCTIHCARRSFAGSGAEAESECIYIERSNEERWEQIRQ